MQVCVIFNALLGSYHVKGISGSPLLDGLVEELAQSYLTEPKAAIENALLNGLGAAAEDESVDLSDAECSRDYSVACPEGPGVQRGMPILVA